MRSTKSHITAKNYHGCSEPVLSSQAGWQLTVTMTKRQPFSVTQTHFFLGMEAQTSPPGHMSYSGAHLTFVVTSFLNFSTPFVYFFGEVSKLSSAGEGQEARPLSQRFQITTAHQYCGQCKEGSGNGLGIHGCQWITTRSGEFFDWANMWLTVFVGQHFQDKNACFQASG